MITGLKFNRGGIYELLNSSEVQQLLKKHSEAISQRAGGGYEVTVQPGVTRAHGRVSTRTQKEFYKELRTNKLARSL